MRSLKIRRAVAGHWKLTGTNQEDHQSWFSYNYMRIWWRTQYWPSYGHSAFEANWKEKKKLNKWVSHELIKDKKKIAVLKCHLLFFYATTMNYLLIGLWHAMKSGFYMTTSEDQLGVWIEKKLKALPKAKVAPKEVMATVRQSAAFLIHYSFVNPSETITS